MVPNRLAATIGLASGAHRRLAGEVLREQAGLPLYEAVEDLRRTAIARRRRDHEIINGSRRKRIARGSGTTVQEVNNLLRQYAQMRKIFKSMGSGGCIKAQ